MDWIKKNPEKLIAILAGLVGLGVGIKSIMEVMALPDRFVVQKVAAKSELPTPETVIVQQSSAILKAPFNWADKLVEIGNGSKKPVPLFRSVTIIEREGTLYDLADPNTPPIRPPVPNPWFIKHNLDLLYSGVLEADADTDGFSNVDEWKADTSPVDAASHPAYWYKLMFVDRRQKNFSIKFSADNDPQFQINITDQLRKSTQFTKAGETFYEGRFTVKKYEKKQGLNKVGIMSNQSTLTLQDNALGGEVVVTVGNETPYPTYYAELNFTLDPNQKQFYVRLGETFTLQKEPSVTYKVESVDSSGSVVTLKLSDGSEAKLEKGVLTPIPERKP